jgi:two-component system sensor histidine kinase KdpD
MKKTPCGISPYLVITFLTIFVTLVGKLVQLHFDEVDLAMLYLLVIIFSGHYYPMRPVWFSIVACVITYDFFIIPKYYSFNIEKLHHIVTLFVMVLIGLVVSRLSQAQRRELERSKALQKHNHDHFQLASVMASLNDSESIAQAAVNYLNDIEKCTAQIWLTRTSLRLLSTHSSFHGQDHRHLISQYTDMGCERLLLDAYLSVYSLNDDQGQFGLLLLRSEEVLVSPPFALPVLTLSLARAESNQTLINLKKSAEREKTRNTLLASVSHDLKTPLGIILGAATTLRDPDLTLDNTVQNELLDTIDYASRGLSLSLSKLLDMTRYSSGELNLKVDWCDLEAIIGAALKRISPFVSDHQICIQMMPLFVKIDGILFEQVISNLVENAARYSPKNTKICIRGSYDSNQLTLTVQDEGQGIPAQELPFIFDRFYRGSNQTSKGTGLGLAICKVIVEAHYGEIRVKNTVARGACFTLVIPCEHYQVDETFHE